MAAINDIQITIPDGCRGHLAYARFRYYGLVIDCVMIVENQLSHDVSIGLPAYRIFHNKRRQIVTPDPALDGQIKTAILRAYRAAVARKEAA